MKKLGSENNIAIDVDETLIMHFFGDGDETVSIIDPYDGITRKFKPHKRHIKLLRDHKARGYTVFLWSHNGSKWAEAVAKALDLTNDVDYVITKFAKVVDDLEPNEFLQTRIYLEDK